MADGMETFRIAIELENPRLPGRRRALRSVLLDTGAELSWIPAEVLESLGIERRSQWRFRQADGTVLERWTGPAFVYAEGRTATADVVFGEPGDPDPAGRPHARRAQSAGRSGAVAARRRGPRAGRPRRADGIWRHPPSNSRLHVTISLGRSRGVQAFQLT